MNAERLLARYERIADASDAIPRLRRFVLDLAVRGKLVPQDAGDEPSSKLLKRIAKEKIDQADLPKGWLKAQLGALLESRALRPAKGRTKARSRCLALMELSASQMNPYRFALRSLSAVRDQRVP